MPGIVTQQPVADGMEGAGPAQPLRDGLTDPAQRLIERFLRDLMRAPAHLHSRPTREGQHENPAGVHTMDDQVGYAMCQRVGLARARAGNDQQWTALDPLVVREQFAKGHSLSLRPVQLLEM